MSNNIPNNITELQQPAAPQPQPAQQPDDAPTPATKQIGLTPRRAGELAAAYARYLDLSEQLRSPLIVPETEALRAEHAGLQKFLGSAFLTHGGELLGCYNLVHGEYEPILRAVAIIFRRIGVAPVLETAQPAAKE